MELQVEHMPLPARVRYDPALTDDQLLHFSSRNKLVWIEREADGTIYMMPTGGMRRGLRIMEVMSQLSRWSDQDGRGKVYSRPGYLLPDGSMRGAPLTWVANDRLKHVRKQDRYAFPRIAPDFVLEVFEPMNDGAYLEAKMDLWMANGVKVAWYIDGDARRVTVYRAGQAAEVLEAPAALRGDGVLSGLVVDMVDIWK